MEPFRPAISEALTLRLFTQGILAQEDFEPQEGGVYLSADGRKKWLLQYERRMEREFMSEFAGHRTTLRRQLDQIVAEYKRGLANPETFRPFPGQLMAQSLHGQRLARQTLPGYSACPTARRGTYVATHCLRYCRS